MPIVATNLTSGGGINASSATTASITPGANRLVLAAVGSRVQGGTPNQPTLSGNGLTWVSILSQNGRLTEYYVTIFRAMGASPSTGAVTIDFAGQSQNQIGWAIADFQNIDTSGTNGSGAIGNTVGGNSGAGSSISLTLAAFGSTKNATYGGCHYETGSSPVITKGVGYTELAQTTTGDTTGALQHQFRNDNDTTVDWTCSVADGGAGIGLEIKAAKSVGVPSTLPFMGVG